LPAIPKEAKAPWDAKVKPVKSKLSKRQAADCCGNGCRLKQPLGSPPAYSKSNGFSNNNACDWSQQEREKPKRGDDPAAYQRDEAR
jgi:hypothetical protein